jgi:hypothetical protein
MRITDATQTHQPKPRLVEAEFRRDPLVLRLRINPDAVTGADLETLNNHADAGPSRSVTEMRAVSHLLSKLIDDWDADDGAPTPEFLFSLPVGLLTDLYGFCWAEICSFKEDVKNIRRYLLSGGKMKSYTPPDYFWDIEDARALGVKPWEIGDVPMHWRYKARVVDAAKKQARVQMAIDGKIPASYQVEI